MEKSYGRDTGKEREERAGDEGEWWEMKQREGMEERGFIEAAGKSSVIAL